MVLRTLVRGNYGGKFPVRFKCHNLHSFNKGVILLCQSILETRRISHLFSSALVTVPLMENVIFCAVPQAGFEPAQNLSSGFIE